jgi:hypothetical protein
MTLAVTKLLIQEVVSAARMQYQRIQNDVWKRIRWIFDEQCHEARVVLVVHGAS